ncbi:unnamed protein product [Arctogadus glacialis]
MLSPQYMGGAKPLWTSPPEYRDATQLRPPGGTHSERGGGEEQRKEDATRKSEGNREERASGHCRDLLSIRSCLSQPQGDAPQTPIHYREEKGRRAEKQGARQSIKSAEATRKERRDSEEEKIEETAQKRRQCFFLLVHQLPDSVLQAASMGYR